MQDFSFLYRKFNRKIIQLLTGFEGNRWPVGPEDELLPEAKGRVQQFM